MEQTVFRGGTEGLTVEQVVRDYDYSMAARHFHDTYELYYLLEGQRYYFIDRKTSTAGNPCHNRILFQISGKLMDPFLRGCGMETMDEVYGEDALIVSVPERGRREIDGLMAQIQRELGDRPKQYLTGVKLKLASLFLALSRYEKKSCFQKETQTAQTWKHQKVYEVADYLLRHPCSQES